MQQVENGLPAAQRSGLAKRLAEYITLSDQPNATHVLDDIKTIIKERREDYTSASSKQRRRWLVGAVATGAVAAYASAKYGHEFAMLSGRRPPMSTLSNRPKGYAWAVTKAIRKTVGPGPLNTRTVVNVARAGMEPLSDSNRKQHRVTRGVLALGLTAASTLHGVEVPDVGAVVGKRTAVEAEVNLAPAPFIANELSVLPEMPAVQDTPIAVPEIVSLGQQVSAKR